MIPLQTSTLSIGQNKSEQKPSETEPKAPLVAGLMDPEGLSMRDRTDEDARLRYGRAEAYQLWSDATERTIYAVQ